MKTPRMVLVGAAALAATSVLAGCSGSGATDADGDVSLTLWARGNSVPDDVEAVLAEQFPDYDITFENIPDIEDKLRAALRSGSGLPDVVMMGGSLPSFFSVADEFVDLSEQAAAGDAVEWGLALGQSPDGRQVALPTDIGPWGFFYRADILESLGYPSEPEEVAAAIDSWDAYRELATTMAETGVYACDHAGQVYQARLAQNGYAYFENEDGEDVNVVDSPISHDAFVESAALAQDDLCANTEPYTPEFNAALTQEDIAAFVGPAWEDGLLKSAGEQQAGNWRVTTLPGGPAATGGTFVSALTASEHPDAAAEVAGFIGGTEFQTIGYLEKGLFPASTGVAEDPKAATPQDYYGGQDTLGALAQTAADAPMVYQAPDSGTVAAQFFVALNDLTASGDDPEDVYASLVEKNVAE
ncbi:cellobiose transport system substrate-binding protein [Microbacterium sp. ZKA21]|uniref:ABC transporter substrate-binding protein n=1 Tax=Microbacterium sp. ZKA21 TaxID=3381694 RepID=UPI003D1F9C30